MRASTRTTRWENGTYVLRVNANNNVTTGSYNIALIIQ